jgi:hypothetical protein
MTSALLVNKSQIISKIKQAHDVSANTSVLPRSEMAISCSILIMMPRPASVSAAETGHFFREVEAAVTQKAQQNRGFLDCEREDVRAEAVVVVEDYALGRYLCYDLTLSVLTI